jgi:hypothetical protein
MAGALDEDELRLPGNYCDRCPAPTCTGSGRSTTARSGRYCQGDAGCRYIQSPWRAKLRYRRCFHYEYWQSGMEHGYCA